MALDVIRANREMIAGVHLRPSMVLRTPHELNNAAEAGIRADALQGRHRGAAHSQGCRKIAAGFLRAPADGKRISGRKSQGASIEENLWLRVNLRG